MTDSATQRVVVSITMRDTLETTTITKDFLPFRDHDETQAALLYDLIDLARLALRVEKDDVWIFGREDEPDEDR